MLILRGQGTSKGPLECLGGIRDVEAGGSNPLTPTKMGVVKHPLPKQLRLPFDLHR